jgi:hypothetical protein
MSEDDNRVPTLADVSGINEQPDDLLDQLAAKRQEVAENKETFIPIPGYDREPPILLARYRLLDGPEIQRLTTKVMRETKNKWDRNMNMAVDTFIAACTGIYVDLGDSGSAPQPLQYQKQPVTGFNADLAAALRFADKIADPNLARNVVFGLFANNDVAIAQHNAMLNRWMGNTSIDITQEMLEGNL